MATKRKSQQEVFGEGPFPFWWWNALEELNPTGDDAPRLRRILRLQQDLRDILDAARAVHEDDHIAQAQTLLKSRRFKQLITAARLLLVGKPSARVFGQPFPLKRELEGDFLLYRILAMERQWVSKLGVLRTRSDYEELITTIRDEFQLSLAWDPFIRLCVWFNKPKLALSKKAPGQMEGGNDVPILPLVFDEARLVVIAVLEGHESDAISRRALLLCRNFQQLRTLSRERLKPQRATFNERRRSLVADYFRLKPRATYFDAWQWYQMNGPAVDRDVDFEAFRRTARQNQPKRGRLPLDLDAVTVRGDNYMPKVKSPAKLRRTSKGR